MNRFEKLFERFDSAVCALITSDINRRYFTGMKSSAGVVLAFPQKAYLLIDFRYIEKAKRLINHLRIKMPSRCIHKTNPHIRKKYKKYILVK